MAQVLSRLDNDGPSALAPETFVPRAGGLPAAAGYGLAVLMVAAATLLAFLAEQLIGAPNLSLIFVLPVTVAAMAFGWGPAFAAVLASVLAFNFFFLEPRHTLLVTDPTDIWALGLLTVVAIIVSGLAAEARRRTIEIRDAGERAAALQHLAHMVVEGRPEAELAQAAAVALQRIFGAPAAILAPAGEALVVTAATGGPVLSTADRAAAEWSFASGLPARAETYPNVAAAFDFWPIVTPQGPLCVIGLDFGANGADRPPAPERFIDIVAAYLAAAYRPARAAATVARL